MSTESTKESHRLELLVQVFNSEGGGAKILDFLHGLVSSGHEGSQGLLFLLHDAEEAVIGNESRGRGLLLMKALEGGPHLGRIINVGLDMGLLTRPQSMPDIASSLLRRLLPSFDSLGFSRSGGRLIGIARHRLRPISDVPQFLHLQKHHHVPVPRFIIVLSKRGEGGHR